MLDGKSLSRASLPIKGGFYHLQVPVAEFVPDKLINTCSRFIKAILIQGADHGNNGCIQPVFNPAVGKGCFVSSNREEGRAPSWPVCRVVF